MLKKQLVIRCYHERYGERLAEYVRKYFSEYFDVATGDVPYDLLLIEDEDSSISDMAKAENCYIIGNERSKENHIIYRYQSADDLIRELLFKSDTKIPGHGGNACNCILFYTPGGSMDQSRLAMDYAAQLTEKKKVLYLYFGEYSEMEMLEKTSGYDMSQLCFLILKKGIEEVSDAKIVASTSRYRGYEILNPFTTPVHMLEVGEAMTMLIESICERDLYDVILCDFQIIPLGIGRLKGALKEIHIVSPLEEDNQEIFKRKYEAFLTLLKQQGLETENIMMKEGRKGQQ